MLWFWLGTMYMYFHYFEFLTSCPELEVFTRSYFDYLLAERKLESWGKEQ